MMNKSLNQYKRFWGTLIISTLLIAFYGCSSNPQDYSKSEEEAKREIDDERTEVTSNPNNSIISFTLQAAVKSSNPDTTVNLLSEDIFSFTITDRTTGNKTALAVDSAGKARMFYAQKTGAFDISLILAGDKNSEMQGIKEDTLIVIRENDPKELSPQIVIRPKNESEIKIIENLLVRRGIGVGSSMIDKPGS